MTPFKQSQRGEGKLGCILTLLVVGAMVAVAFKIGPVYYGNMELADAADFKATMGSRVPAEQVESEMRSKAKELGVLEALKPGGIKVTKTSSGDSGTCTITLKYTCKVDLYGFTTVDIKQDKVITKQTFSGL